MRSVVVINVVALILGLGPMVAGEPLPVPPPGLRVEAGHGLLSGWRDPASLATAQLPGHLGRSPYAPTSHGYDLSYPACDKGRPQGGDFAVVGVNGGRPFSRNPCLALQWWEGGLATSVYLNTGYQPDYPITSGCAKKGRLLAGSTDQQMAYEIGCSEVELSLAYLDSAVPHARIPAIWLDVETENSWSEADLTLNLSELSGMIDRLTPLHIPIGVYSFPPMWKAITGGLGHRAIAADWVVSEDVSKGCAQPGFSGAPAWMTQEVDTTWPGNFDSDRAC